MHFFRATGRLVLALVLTGTCVNAQDLASVAKTYRPRLETNLTRNIIPFWYPRTLDRTNGGYLLNHDINGQFKGRATKMIVTQSRMVWWYAHLARTGYGGPEFLDAAGIGYRFLIEKMWDDKNGGFYWEVNVTGSQKLKPKKHLYGQAFALYALSEYSMAAGSDAARDLATRLFNLIEAKAHDSTNGGYLEWFNEDWSTPSRGETTYMGEPDYKLMNTHLHLLEAMTAYYRATKNPLARERLLELIQIQSSTVVRKTIGACTDKYEWNWTPVLTGNYARVSYGHDLENIWLLADACDAAGVSSSPLLDLDRALFDYALKFGFDARQGGFFDSGPISQPANKRDKIYWVQAEALVSSLYMYRLTHESKYLEIFQKTYDWVDQHQVDWKNGEWFDTIRPDGTPTGDKAQVWKAGYHVGRSMIECLEIFKAGRPPESGRSPR